ncbi:hypothetical protein SESBI_30390, partial [Sesbania bispinosa]
KISLQGLSLHEAKRGVSNSFLGENKNGSSISRRRLEIPFFLLLKLNVALPTL